MARTFTLLQLRTRARQRGDFVNSTFVSDTELNDYVNDSIAELYDILVQKFGTDYYVSTDDTVLVAGTKSYALPTDFYKLLGVDAFLGAVDASDAVTLKPFMFIERNRTDVFRSSFRYRLRGNNIILQDENIGSNIRVWYVAAATVLTLDADTFDGINGWEEYVIIDAAIKMREKEETDTSALERAKFAIKQRIEEAADNRDIGQSERVTDVRPFAMDDDFQFFNERLF